MTGPGSQPTPHAGTDEVLVEVKGLHKSFGKLHVLKGVDFVVHRGEVVVLLLDDEHPATARTATTRAARSRSTTSRRPRTQARL